MKQESSRNLVIKMYLNTGHASELWQISLILYTSNEHASQHTHTHNRFRCISEADAMVRHATLEFAAAHFDLRNAKWSKKEKKNKFTKWKNKARRVWSTWIHFSLYTRVVCVCVVVHRVSFNWLSHLLACVFEKKAHGRRIARRRCAHRERQRMCIKLIKPG